MLIPQTQAEYDVWKAIVSLPKGKRGDFDVSDKKKHNVKRHFYVQHDKLKCVKSHKEVVILDKLEA